MRKIKPVDSSQLIGSCFICGRKAYELNESCRLCDEGAYHDSCLDRKMLAIDCLLLGFHWPFKTKLWHELDEARHKLRMLRIKNPLKKEPTK